MTKSTDQQYFIVYCLHTRSIYIFVQVLVEYSNYSNKPCIQRCSAYQKGGASQHGALISMWIPRGVGLIRGRCLFEAWHLLEEIQEIQYLYSTYIHKYIHASIHPSIHTYIHTQTHTYIQTYIHTYIHIYIYIYTMCVCVAQ